MAPPREPPRPAGAEVATAPQLRPAVWGKLSAPKPAWLPLSLAATSNKELRLWAQRPGVKSRRREAVARRHQAHPRPGPTEFALRSAAGGPPRLALARSRRVRRPVPGAPAQAASKSGGPQCPQQATPRWAGEVLLVARSPAVQPALLKLAAMSQLEAVPPPDLPTAALPHAVHEVPARWRQAQTPVLPWVPPEVWRRQAVWPVKTHLHQQEQALRCRLDGSSASSGLTEEALQVRPQQTSHVTRSPGLSGPTAKDDADAGCHLRCAAPSTGGPGGRPQPVRFM